MARNLRGPGRVRDHGAFVPGAEGIEEGVRLGAGPEPSAVASTAIGLALAAALFLAGFALLVVVPVYNRARATSRSHGEEGECGA